MWKRTSEAEKVLKAELRTITPCASLRISSCIVPGVMQR